MPESVSWGWLLIVSVAITIDTVRQLRRAAPRVRRWRWLALFCALIAVAAAVNGLAAALGGPHL